MQEALEDHDPRLRGINLVVGERYHSSLFSSNVYAIGKNTITLVDAGDGTESNNITSAFRRINLNPKNIIKVAITHTHDDHWGGLVELLQIIPIIVMVFKEDIEYYQKEIDQLVGATAKKYEIVGLEDGETIEADGRRLTVIHTPGHDTGSICFYDEKSKILFSGDTVFSSGTTGSLRSGNITDMKKSLKRLAELSIDILLPGHGDLAFKNANEAVKLALERTTWNESVPKGAFYRIKS